MIVKLKSPTIHALRILKSMGNEECAIGSKICQKVDVTHSYFMRIAKELKSAGILETVQGRYGGFILSRRLEDISLYDVVRAMEGEQVFLAEKDMELLSTLVEEMNKAIAQQLRETSVAMIVEAE